MPSGSLFDSSLPTSSTVSKNRSLTAEQFDWYASQPVEYRRQWWAWAMEEPNFDRMVAEFREDDPVVLRFRNLAVEKRSGHKVQAVRAKEEQGN